jgi:hypothetical protein
MARRERNGFKKLLGNVKMNALSQDSNGEWTLINSATNKRRMKYGGAGLAYDSDPEFAVEGNDRWIPAKCYITEMDLREIWHDQGEVCYWFKIPLDFNLLFASCPDYMPKHPLAPSVDRIDDALDYTKDNVVICCRLANFGRNTCNFKKFQEIVDTIFGEKKIENTLHRFFI